METADGRNYLLPFVLVTTLFFLWGFAHSILDVLNKHVQMQYQASYGESALIQCSVYMAYFLGALPAGLMIRRYGTRQGVIAGLLLFSVGAFLFVPMASVGRLLALLAPLFVLGVGLCLLETAANPYVTLLGDSRTASSRINMSQTFNGLGCMFGALLSGLYFFSDGSTKSGDDIKTVQENLGHATAAFTLDVYGHVTKQMKQDSAARMEQFIKSVSDA